jgi:hypothetical protein
VYVSTSASWAFNSVATDASTMVEIRCVTSHQQSAYMVLRQSTECKKTLRKAVIQRHKLNGNAVEVCLNHAIQYGLLHIKILEAINSCGCVTF